MHFHSKLQNIPRVLISFFTSHYFTRQNHILCFMCNNLQVNSLGLNHPVLAPQRSQKRHRKRQGTAMQWGATTGELESMRIWPWIPLVPPFCREQRRDIFPGDAPLAAQLQSFLTLCHTCFSGDLAEWVLLGIASTEHEDAHLFCVAAAAAHRFLSVGSLVRCRWGF